MRPFNENDPESCTAYFYLPHSTRAVPDCTVPGGVKSMLGLEIARSKAALWSQSAGPVSLGLLPGAPACSAGKALAGSGPTPQVQ